MELVVVSGLSGSGKSAALDMLEDLGWYCVHNIPAAVLMDVVSYALRDDPPVYRRLAVGLDSRDQQSGLCALPKKLMELRESGLDARLVYLHADDRTLTRRFAETRRRHPLTNANTTLVEALAAERELMMPLARTADLIIDTSTLGLHDLREAIRQRMDKNRDGGLSVVFLSFGYKGGLPGEADFVFDVRTLPNPYWEPALRELSGRDPEVVAYLDAAEEVSAMADDIASFVARRIPEYRANNRAYLTVAIGCTGGQHRSVYLTERLARHFAGHRPPVLVRHTALKS